MNAFRPVGKWSLFALLAGGLTFSACKKKTADPPDLGYNYYPAQVGSFIIYDVDSIAHNDNNNSVITYQFQLKETIESTFDDDSGRKSFRIERSRRSDASKPWVLNDVWYSTLTATGLEQVEENLRLLKLTFPPEQGENWNGNVLNSEPREQYEYLEVDVPATVNGHAFDSTLYVKQVDESNLIEIRFANERYARGIGMIYKEFTDLDLQSGAGVEVTVKINSWSGQ